MSITRSGNRTVICSQNLYKSSHKKNSFFKDHKYNIVEETDKFFYILDEEKRPINFAKENHGVFHYFEDYFILN